MLLKKSDSFLTYLRFNKISPLFIIVSISFLLYLSVLLTSQSHVDGDEAVVGIMAKHIIMMDYFPIFFLSQPYGGGGAIEAYLAVIPFLLFGVSSLTFKSIALFFSLATIIVTYKFCLIHFNKKTAIFSSIILASATPLIEWHFKMRGGYIIVLFLSIIILHIFTEIIKKEHNNRSHYLLLGFTSGFAYYNMELIVPLLTTLFIASFYWKKKFWSLKKISLIIAGCITGLLPVIYYNLTNDFLNIHYILNQRGENILLLFKDTPLKIVFNYLPAFFFGRNADQYITDIPGKAYLEYIIYLGLTIYLFFNTLPYILLITKNRFNREKNFLNNNALNIISIILLFIVIFFIFSVISKGTQRSPRYFLPLYPLLAILIGYGLNTLIINHNILHRTGGVCVLLLLVCFGVFNHVSYIRPCSVNDDVLINEKDVVNVPTSCKTLTGIMEYLKKEGISRVRATYFLKWRLLFESNEQMIASTHGLSPGGYRDILYDEYVNAGDKAALILHKNDIQLKRFMSSSYCYKFKQTMIGEYYVFTGKQPEKWKSRYYLNKKWKLPGVEP